MTKPGPGKFEGNESLEIAEYLYATTLDGAQEDNFGSVSENGHWEALILLSDRDILQAEPLLQPAYIVYEDSNGFFSYHGYDSEEQAREQYNSDLHLYEVQVAHSV